MSYNGIGLQTARGSGTNGYVQRNLSFVRIAKPKVDYKTEDEIRRFESEYAKPPNQEILEHHRKRKIEVECLELEEKLEKTGLNEDEVQKKVDEFRQEKYKKMEKSLENRHQFIMEILNERSVKESHQLAELSKDRNDKFKSALKISEDYVPGSSMDIIRQAKEQQAAREEKLRANKDLIAATLKTDQPDNANEKGKDAKRQKKNALSSSESESSDSDSSSSSSSDSSTDSDSSDSESSDSSDSDTSDSSSEDSDIDIGKDRYYKDKKRPSRSHSHDKKHYKSTHSSKEERRDHRQKRSASPVEKSSRAPRDDSPPRKYSRYSSNVEPSRQSNSPPRRQMPSFISSVNIPARYRSRSSSTENAKKPKYNSRPAYQRSKSPRGDSRSRSRSNSYVSSRRRERSVSRSVSPKNSRSYEHRESRNGAKPQRRTRSRSPLPRKDFSRRRSSSRERYRGSKGARRRSPSSSLSRSPSRERRGRDKDFTPKSERSSRSRSRSIPRRRGSPSFLDKRRITSARKPPVPYRRTDSSSSPTSLWSPKSSDTPLHRNLL